MFCIGKKFFLIWGLVLFFLAWSFRSVSAQPNTNFTKQEDKVNIVVFLRQGCIHCDAEEKFLENLGKKRQDIIVTEYRLENTDDRKIWTNFTSRISISKVTPITVIGEDYLIGFDRPETTGEEIINLIEKAQINNIETDLANIKGGDTKSKTNTCPADGQVPCTEEALQQPYFISLPFIGRIDGQKYPLFILSAMLGLFDGFNPCAMWVLVTFLIILLQVGNRRKMFIFAGIFILAEAIMYLLILTVWYKTWDFVNLDNIITPIVGAVAIAGGIFFLNEWRKKEIECKVTDADQRQKTRQKIQQLATGKFTVFTFLAILGLAFSVNIIEFTCSIGIPQAFTKILELNKLSLLQSGVFLAVYILFYMIDDFIVFGIALYGMDKLALTTRYSKISNFVGGIVMIILGFILIFKPHLILF